MILLFKNGKLLRIDNSEDSTLTNKITVIIPLTEDKKHYVKDKIYTLVCEREGYIFRCTQSPFNDNSGLNNGMNGYHQTIGNAIHSVHTDSHAYEYSKYGIVYINNIIIPKL